MNSTKIFNRASVTHFYSSLFFPPQARAEVTIVYAFARIIDDSVDESADPEESFSTLRRLYNAIKSGEQIPPALKYTELDKKIITDFVNLKRYSGIEDLVVEALFNSMEMDLKNRTYHNFLELEQYMFGVASAIGLMLCRVLNLPRDADPYAIEIGYVAQYTNILRDIGADKAVGRVYIPLTELQKFGLESIDYDYVKTRKAQFQQFIYTQVQRVKWYHKKGEPGLAYLDKGSRTALKTAIEMYFWTLDQIFTDPFIVYKKKVKPALWRVIAAGVSNRFRPD